MTILIKLMDNKNSNRIVIRIERAQLNVVVILINCIVTVFWNPVWHTGRHSSDIVVGNGSHTESLHQQTTWAAGKKAITIHSQWPVLRRSTLYRRMLFLIGSLRFHLKMRCRKREIEMEMPIKFDSLSLSLIHSLTHSPCIYVFLLTYSFIYGKMRASKSSSINIFCYYAVIFFSLFRSLTFSLPLSFLPLSPNHCIKQMGN